MSLKYGCQRCFKELACIQCGALAKNSIFENMERESVRLRAENEHLRKMALAWFLAAIVLTAWLTLRF